VVEAEEPRRGSARIPEVLHDDSRAAAGGADLLHFDQAAQGTAQTLGDVFRWDGLHYNDKGYAIWSSTIKSLFA
jgi:hypothetical protein